MDECMQQKLQTPNNSNWHAFLHNQVPDTETVEIMQIALVPAFLVYDGFESNLQADVVYERVLSLADQNPTSVAHLRNFLQSCLVKSIQGEPKPYAAQEIYMATVPIQAKKWAKDHVAQLHPTASSNF